jgi:hypothetical protein
MSPAETDAPGLVPDADLDGLGIIRRPVDYFHVGEFRYTNREDAVAQAERARNARKLTV